MSASLRLFVIERLLSEIRPHSVIEVGCGMGAMAYRLASRYEYRGYEPDDTSCRIASEYLVGLGRGEITNDFLPAEPERVFDLLVAFEVLEHIEDDVSTLMSWSRWVKQGGSMLLSVPANPRRFGRWDRAVGHYRRYDREGLSGVLYAAGLEVSSIAAWGMPFGYLLEAGRNRSEIGRQSSDGMEQRTSRSGRLMQPPAWMGRGVEIVMMPFAAMQRPFAPTDFGIGLVAHAIRPT